MADPIRLDASTLDEILHRYLATDEYVFVRYVADHVADRMKELVVQRVLGQALNPDQVAERMLSSATDAWRGHCKDVPDTGDDWMESNVAMDLALRGHLTREQYVFVKSVTQEHFERLRAKLRVAFKAQLTGREMAEQMHAATVQVNRECTS